MVFISLFILIYRVGKACEASEFIELDDGSLVHVRDILEKTSLF